MPTSAHPPAAATSAVGKCFRLVAQGVLLTADGAFIGGIIQPGVGTSADTLFRRTSQLSATELIPPKKVIGTRTDECIRSGVLYGAADSIDRLVEMIKAEWNVPNPLVIGTGGLAETLRASLPVAGRGRPVPYPQGGADRVRAADRLIC